MGVANDHSIAWGIAKTLSQHGAELAFTYQGEALGSRVTPLAQSLGSDLVLPCDVEDIAFVDAAFDALDKKLGQSRFRGSRHRLFRQVAAQGLLRGRHHARQLFPHHGDLLLLLHGDRPARGEAHEERRIAADAHLWRLHPRHAELQRDGRRQGGPGGQRPLYRGRSRARWHSLQRHLGGSRSARSRAPASPMRA